MSLGWMGTIHWDLRTRIVAAIPTREGTISDWPSSHAECCSNGSSGLPSEVFRVGAEVLLIWDQQHEEEFIALLLQSLIVDQPTVEPKFMEAMTAMSGVADPSLIGGLVGRAGQSSSGRYG